MTPADAQSVVRACRRRTSRSKRACAAPSGCTTIFSPSTRTTALRRGWNNLIFPNVAMPHVLWRALRHQPARHARSSRTTRGAGRGARRQGHRRARRPGKDHTYVVEDARRRDARHADARSSTSEMVADLVNFLDYMAEPAKNKRIEHRARRAPLPRRAVHFRVLDETRVLEGRSLKQRRPRGRPPRRSGCSAFPVVFRPRCPNTARHRCSREENSTHDDALFRDHRPFQPALPHRAAREGHGFPDHRRRPRPQARGPRGDESRTTRCRCWSSATSCCTSRTSSTSTSTSAFRIRS